MANVLLATFKLLVIEMVGEMTGEINVHEEAIPSMVASPGVVHPVGILSMVIRDRAVVSFTTPHLAPTECRSATREVDDCLTQSLKVGRCLPLF